MFSCTESQLSNRERIHSLNTIVLKETVDQIQLMKQFEKPKRNPLRHCSQILDDFPLTQYKFLLERRLLKQQKIEELRVRQRRFSCNCSECGQQSKKVKGMYQTYLESPTKGNENAIKQTNKILFRKVWQKPINTMKYISRPSLGPKQHECGKESPRKSIKILRRQSDNNALQWQQSNQKLKIYNSYRASLLNNILEQSSNNSGMKQMNFSPLSQKFKTENVLGPTQSCYRYSCKRIFLNNQQSNSKTQKKIDYSNTNIPQNRAAFIISCYISQNKSKRTKGKY